MRVSQGGKGAKGGGPEDLFPSDCSACASFAGLGCSYSGGVLGEGCIGTLGRGFPYQYTHEKLRPFRSFPLRLHPYLITIRHFQLGPALDLYSSTSNK